MSFINSIFRNKQLDCAVSLKVQPNSSKASKADLERKEADLFKKVSEKSFFPNWIESSIGNWRKTAIKSSITQHVNQNEVRIIAFILKDMVANEQLDALVEKYRDRLPEDKINYVFRNSERIKKILVHYHAIKFEKNNGVTEIKIDSINIKKVANYLNETINGELLLEKHSKSYAQFRASNKNALLQILNKDAGCTGFLYKGEKQLELMDKAFANRFIQQFFADFSPNDTQMIFRAISHKLKEKGKNWGNGITKELIEECKTDISTKTLDVPYLIQESTLVSLVSKDDLKKAAMLQRFADKFDEAQLGISIFSQIQKENPKILEEFGLRNCKFQLFDLISKDFDAKSSKNIENANFMSEEASFTSDEDSLTLDITNFIHDTTCVIHDETSSMSDEVKIFRERFRQNNVAFRQERDEAADLKKKLLQKDESAEFKTFIEERERPVKVIEDEFSVEEEVVVEASPQEFSLKPLLMKNMLWGFN